MVFIYGRDDSLRERQDQQNVTADGTEVVRHFARSPALLWSNEPDSAA